MLHADKGSLATYCRLYCIESCRCHIVMALRREPMPGDGRQLWQGFVAVFLAVVLCCASFVSAQARSRHICLHALGSTAALAHEHGHIHGSVALDAEESEGAEPPGSPHHDHHQLPHDHADHPAQTQHAGCCDLMCHGASAILPSGQPVPGIGIGRKLLRPADDALRGCTLALLDRPPRLDVHA